MEVRIKPATVGTLLFAVSIAQAQAQYLESGKPGDPASWRSAEFLRDWGLERMQADQAYAAGITGKGVKIGALDSGFDASHPEFASARYHPVMASGSYVDGSLFNVDGTLNPNNDSHGTHVVGTMGASRDGTGTHGVAYNAQIYVGNTNKNDSFLFGPNPDPRYFKAVYDALADAGVRAINNSWGSQPPDVSYRTLADLHAAYAQHWNKGTWIDAAADVSRRGVINVFSAGNSGYPNASVRSALPYFQPDLEGHWLAVSGLDQSNQQKYNQCGLAKYWCITTPGAKIDSTIPGGGYAIKSGTSMSAPHATGALALVMERYPYMNNQQALEVLLTTATQLDGSVTDVPTERIGWGVVNLNRAMHGPGQLLGAFDADLAAGQSDVWSNAISDKALIQRQSEDLAEHSAWQQTLQDKGWQNGVAAAAPANRIRPITRSALARDAAAAKSAVSGQPGQVRSRAPDPHRRQHLSRRDHGQRRFAHGQRLADVRCHGERQRHPRRFRTHRRADRQQRRPRGAGQFHRHLERGRRRDLRAGFDLCRGTVAHQQRPDRCRRHSQRSAAPRSACHWKTARRCSAPPSAKSLLGRISTRSCKRPAAFRAGSARWCRITCSSAAASTTPPTAFSSTFERNATAFSQRRPDPEPACSGRSG
jgi:subtilisin family serine protease